MTEGRGLEALGSNFVIGSAQATLGRDPEVIALPRSKEARARLPTPAWLARAPYSTRGLQGVSVFKLGEVRDGIDTEAVVGGLLSMC